MINQNFKYRFILIVFILMPVIFVFAQDNHHFGYFQIPDTSRWQVVMNDSIIRSSGQAFVSLRTGLYEMVIYPKNVKDWSVVSIKQDVEIISGDTVCLQLSEIPMNTDYIPDYSGKPRENLPDLGMLTSPKKTSGRYLRPALLFTAVTTNWAAFYLKRQADDYYSDYTRTSDLSKIKKSYDHASQFDTYSIVMLGISATAMLTYMYLLLSD